MSSYSLKMLALFSMLCDHVGYVFFPNFIIFRVIGRLAFPIYAFLIAEGYRRTSNANFYAFRLAVFALASEIPFDLAIYNQPFYMDGQNVFITLFFGLLSIMLYDRLTSRRQHAAAMIAVLLCAFAATLLRSDYQFVGVLMIFVFFVCKDRRAMILWFMALVALNALTQILCSPIITMDIIVWGIIQTAELGALPFVLRYNTKQGPRLKYFFYASYPMHLLLLYVIDNRFWIF